MPSKAKKRCSECKEWFPSTTDYFSMNGTRLHSMCKPCLKAYHKRYSKTNKNQNYRKNRYQEKLPEIKEKRTDYNSKNQTVIRDKARKYYYADKAKNGPRQISEATRLYRKQWAKDNPGKKAAALERYRSRKLNAPGSFTEKEFVQIYKLYKGKCAYCGKKVPYSNVQRDHVIPLSKGGSNFISNIVPACVGCNSRKGAQLGWTPRNPNV